MKSGPGQANLVWRSCYSSLRRRREDGMVGARLIGTVAIVLTTGVAGAQPTAKYPDWAGAWERIGGGSYDPSKPVGRAQQPPLTAEYQAIWERNLAEEAAGGQEYNTQAHCLPGGMPRMMIA